MKFIINKKRRSVVSCTECRRKKQKCDEIKPSCTQCLKSGVSCVYNKTKYSQNNKKIGNKKIRRETAEFNSNKNQSTIEHSYSDKIEELNMDNNNNQVDLVAFNNEFDDLLQLDAFVEDIPSIFGSPIHDFDLPMNFGLDLDLEFRALTLLSTSENMKSYFNKYNYHSYSFLRTLAYSNKAVLYTLTGWILSINQNPEAEEFLNQSIKLLKSGDSITPEFNDECIGIIVSQTCLCILSSSQGNYNLWHSMFEELYKLLDKLGIDRAIDRVKNSTAICWVLGWLFYQDIFKVGTFFNKSISGPLFPKTVHQKFINERAVYRKKDVGRICSSCTDLIIIMGEIKTLYDLFFIHLKNSKKLDDDKFINSTSNKELPQVLSPDIYRQNDEIQNHFYKWFKYKVDILEEKLAHTEINIDDCDYPLEQQENLKIFHSILKKSLKVFLRVKILGILVSNYEIKLLCSEILKGINQLVSWDLNNYILFPFFIVGTSLYEENDKFAFTNIYKQLKVYLQSGNLSKVWETIQNVWRHREATGIQTNKDYIAIHDFDVCLF